MDRPVNIFLSEHEMKSMKDANDATEYLIMQNNKILQERDRMKEELARTKARLDDIIEDADRDEKRIINLKGFAKNLAELNATRITMADYYRLYQNDTARLLKHQYEEYTFLVLTMLGLFLCELLSLVFGATGITFVMFVIALIFMRHMIKSVWSDVLNGKNLRYDDLVLKWVDIIRGCKKDVKEITKGNDFLDELIDAS